MKRKPSKNDLTYGDIFDAAGFLDWLDRSTSLTARSKRDVCSRLKRLSTFVNLDKIKSVDDLDRVFTERNAAELPATVSTQLKRVAVLYLAFQAGKRK